MLFSWCVCFECYREERSVIVGERKGVFRSNPTLPFPFLEIL